MSDQQSTQSMQTAPEVPSDGATATTTAVSPNGAETVAMHKDKTKADVLLEVDRLVKFFPVRGGLLQRTVAWVKAVDDVSFFVRRGRDAGPRGRVGLRQDYSGPHNLAAGARYQRAGAIRGQEYLRAQIGPS